MPVINQQPTVTVEKTQDFPIKPDENIQIPLKLFIHLVRLSHNTQARKLLKNHMGERREKLKAETKVKSTKKGKSSKTR